jgi:hypothetical protein
MKVWIIWEIPDDLDYESPTIIKAFDAKEKAKNFMWKHTGEIDPKPEYLYTALKNDDCIGGYSYEVLDVE